MFSCRLSSQIAGLGIKAFASSSNVLTAVSLRQRLELQRDILPPNAGEMVEARECVAVVSTIFPDCKVAVYNKINN